MKLKFTKMHGAGNDFIVLNAIDQVINLTWEQYRFLADRRYGIGADQILLVEKPDNPEVDFKYRIFNSDGGEVEQCGNGARAFAKFVTESGLSRQNPIKVETRVGIIELHLEKDGSVTVDMGNPVFETSRIPFLTKGLTSDEIGSDTIWNLILDTGGIKKSIPISVVSMGNPHAVQIVDDVNRAAVAEEGPLIENHERFPERVNAGFMEIQDRHSIKLRVYERGAAETLACGTGACAAVVSGIRRKLLDSPVTVKARGGELKIAWEGEGHNVIMSGPAIIVFNGEINL